MRSLPSPPQTMREIATGGIVGIAVVLGELLVGQDVARLDRRPRDRAYRRDPAGAALVVAAALSLTPHPPS
jgi:hypothetical protein